MGAFCLLSRYFTEATYIVRTDRLPFVTSIWIEPIQLEMNIFPLHPYSDTYAFAQAMQSALSR